MNFSLFIARRTALRPQRTDGSRASRSPAVGFAVTAVALSLAVMICALAVVAGFKQQILEKIAGFNAHLQVYRVTENYSTEPEGDVDNLITLTPTLRGILDDQPYINEYELELTVPALLKTSEDFKGVYIKGADGKGLRHFLSTQTISGNISERSESAGGAIAISKTMAAELDLKAGDTISTFFLNNDIVARRYRVAALYETHFEHFDDLIALGEMSELQSVTGIDKGKGVSLRILTDDFDRAEEYAQSLQQRLNEAYMTQEVNIPYRVESVTARSAAYFSWLQLLDTNVIVILSLMTVVACITLIAAMLILIIDKVRLIGILRAMGASRRTVRRIFIFMALRIALYGLITGNAIGLAICWIQMKWHILPLNAEGYYIDFVPVNLQWPNIVILNAAIAAVIFLSLILPSLVAGRISPAESMRYQD